MTMVQNNRMVQQWRSSQPLTQKLAPVWPRARNRVLTHSLVIILLTGSLYLLTNSLLRQSVLLGMMEAISGAYLLMMMAILAMAASLVRLKQATTRRKQELEQAHARLLIAREEERKALARELHDGPMQELLALSYRVRHYGRKEKGARAAAFEVLRADSLRLLDELRGICTALRPPYLDMQGLRLAIQSHAERQMPQITLHLMPDDGRLPDEVAIALFRIYQEAVNNANKYADAQQIAVNLKLFATSCRLTIQDDGRGFVVPASVTSLAREQHFGLLGMQERAEALGGTFQVISAPGMGTTITVVVPI